MDQALGLKTCPFCGNNAHLVCDNGLYQVYCEWCLVCTADDSKKDVAIQDWNRRVLSYEEVEKVLLEGKINQFMTIEFKPKYEKAIEFIKSLCVQYTDKVWESYREGWNDAKNDTACDAEDLLKELGEL